MSPPHQASQAPTPPSLGIPPQPAPEPGRGPVPPPRARPRRAFPPPRPDCAAGPLPPNRIHGDPVETHSRPSPFARRLQGKPDEAFLLFVTPESPAAFQAASARESRRKTPVSGFLGQPLITRVFEPGVQKRKPAPNPIPRWPRIAAPPPGETFFPGSGPDARFGPTWREQRSVFTSVAALRRQAGLPSERLRTFSAVRPQRPFGGHCGHAAEGPKSASGRVLCAGGFIAIGQWPSASDGLGWRSQLDGVPAAAGVAAARSGAGCPTRTSLLPRPCVTAVAPVYSLLGSRPDRMPR